jgi:hypothetical protein
MNLFITKSFVMKLKSLIAVAAVGLLFSCSEPYRATDQTLMVTVPDGTRSTFTTQYPTASNIIWSGYDQVVVPIDWELSGWAPLDTDDYVVQFDMDNQRYYAWYDVNGNWVGTAYALQDHSSLPMEVTSKLNSEFSGYTISSVNTEFQKDRIAYEIELKNSTDKAKVLIDAQGNILKKKVKTVQ